MTTTEQAPPREQCGAVTYAQDGSERTAVCSLKPGHRGWHEGKIRNVDEETEEWMTWIGDWGSKA